MASFFKFTCSAFWIIWMFIFSFAFGVNHIEVKYTYLQYVDSVVVKLLMAASTLTVVMAIIGCLSIKCDINNICFTFWYIVPMIAGITTICAYLMILCGYQPANLEPGEVLRLIKKEYDTKNQIPSFLQYSQAFYSCCGIYGPKDFRAFILNPAVDQDIPFSCCHSLAEGQSDTCYVPSGIPVIPPDPMTMYDFFKDREIPGSPLPIPLPTKRGKVDQSALNKIIIQLYGPDGPITRKTHRGRRKYKKAGAARQSDPYSLPYKDEKLKAINTKGCYEDIRKNADLVVNLYVGFSVFLIVCSILMSILFVQNCLKVRRRHKEAIQFVMETGRPPRMSLLEQDFSEEEYKQILRELKNPKKKLEVGMGGEGTVGGIQLPKGIPRSSANKGSAATGTQPVPPGMAAGMQAPAAKLAKFKK